jgi:hypothetical protein
MKTALIKDLEKLAAAIQLGNHADIVSATAQVLEPVLEYFKERPAWMRDNVIVDPEVLSVISSELFPMCYNAKDKIEIEDSRSLTQVCIEAAEIFTEMHYSDAENYWADKDFLDDILRFTREVFEALCQRPDWINVDHTSIRHSGDSLRQFLLRYHIGKDPLLKLLAK